MFLFRDSQLQLLEDKKFSQHEIFEVEIKICKTKIMVFFSGFKGDWRAYPTVFKFKKLPLPCHFSTDVSTLGVFYLQYCLKLHQYTNLLAR